MENILIYSDKITARLKYTLKLVFKDLLLIRHELTNDLEIFAQSDQPKFSYTEKSQNDGLFFCANGLLFERGTRTLEIAPFDYEGLKVFFPVYDKKSALPFDAFAAIFYLVTRYEEYLPFVRDTHGRFTAHLCLSAKLGIVDKPVVNIWANKIRDILCQHYPQLSFPEKKYRFIPTYDIDSAYAYLHKGPVRTLGAYFLSVKSLDWDEVALRTKVLLGKQKDPFDTYDLQIEYQKKYNLKPIYFILFGRYGRFDKNLNTRNRLFRFLIKRLGDYAKIGIHPSYGTAENPKQLAAEVSSLSKAINKDVIRSRQHFLRLMMPHTYRNLIEHDILHDYTMGYAYLPGFRAGICSTYNFYDLELEIETHLRLHPFAVMDGTLNDYMGLTPEDAIRQIGKLIDEVKKVRGTFISLWHNESLSDEKRWKGWRRVYEKLLEMAVNDTDQLTIQE